MPLEDKDASLENKDASLEDKDASLEDKNASLEDKTASLENKDVLLEDKDASLENKDALLEDKNASLKDKNALLDSTPIRTNSMVSSCEASQNKNTDIEESSSSTSTKETVEEVGEETGDQIVDRTVDDKDNSNLDSVIENWRSQVVDSIGVVDSVKMNLYDASGYIERTIDDGPEDEGDDSVFERIPSENETIEKAPPGRIVSRRSPTIATCIWVCSHC